MYLSYEQVVADATVKDKDDLTIPGNATHAELQADTQQIRYTMDDTTAPTASSGMVLVVDDDPKTFLIEDILRIKFIRGAGSDGNLNVHYFGGRDV